MPPPPSANATTSGKPLWKKKRAWAGAFVALLALSPFIADEPPEDEVQVGGAVVTTTAAPADEVIETTTKTTTAAETSTTTEVPPDPTTQASPITVTGTEVDAARNQLAEAQLVDSFARFRITNAIATPVAGGPTQMAIVNRTATRS